MALNNSTDDNFEKEVLGCSIPSVCQFSASWCAPCTQLKPLMEELSKELTGKIKFFYHDIESSPNTPSHYGVRGVPTLLIFNNKELKSTKVGAILQKSILKSWLLENI